jgi:hypothetical protein
VDTVLACMRQTAAVVLARSRWPRSRAGHPLEPQFAVAVAVAVVLCYLARNRLTPVSPDWLKPRPPQALSLASSHPHGSLERHPRRHGLLTLSGNGNGHGNGHGNGNGNPGQGRPTSLHVPLQGRAAPPHPPSSRPRHRTLRRRRRASGPSPSHSPQRQPPTSRSWRDLC